MAERAQKRATYEDLLAVPERMIAEIVDGDLHTSPRPAPKHSHASSAIGGGLFNEFNRDSGGPGGPGGWLILDEPELHLGDDILVPDIAGWRRERLRESPSEPYMSLPPDWVCEVQSPSTVRMDRVHKKRIYAREGVQYMWLVDPEAETLEVLARSGDFWQEVGLYSGDDKVRAVPFDAVELDLSRWWWR